MTLNSLNKIQIWGSLVFIDCKRGFLTVTLNQEVIYTTAGFVIFSCV